MGKRIAQIIEYSLRHCGLLGDILEGEVAKKRGREKPRLKYFTHLMKDM